MGIVPLIYIISVKVSWLRCSDRLCWLSGHRLCPVCEQVCARLREASRARAVGGYNSLAFWLFDLFPLRDSFLYTALIWFEMEGVCWRGLVTVFCHKANATFALNPTPPFKAAMVQSNKVDGIFADKWPNDAHPDSKSKNGDWAICNHACISFCSFVSINPILFCLLFYPDV